MTDSTLEPRSGLRSREKALDQSANVLDLDTDLNFRQTLRIVGRGLKYIRFFKLRFAGKFFLMWLSLLTPLILPWPIKIVIDNVILGLPIGEGTVYPPYFAPFVNFLDGKSPVEMMSWVLLLGASWVILLGAFGASGGSQDYTDGFLAEGHDTATKTENEANQAASKIAGLLGFFEYRLNLRLTQSLNHLMRAQLFERINHLPMRLLNDQRIGDSVYRMMYDTPSITNVFYQVIISPTLAYLVPGFYDAVEGNVEIDGHDVGDIALRSLRAQVSYVFQETHLFSDSILDNIRYGNTTAGREEVERVAKIAGAHDFISELPDGYQTRLGTVTSKLSVGQKQRIAIARGLLKDASILILDEPTSALDPETETYLVNSLHEAAKNKLVIIIAHRLSTIAHADRIIFLEEGKIIEQGSHQQLLADPDGHYSRFVALQSASTS